MTKITNLPSLASPADNDYLVIVDMSTNSTKKIQKSDLFTNVVTTGDGWIPVNDAWAYSSYDSANDTGVINVPSDATSKYQNGMRIKFTQGGNIQYAIVTKVTATALTIYLGNNYTLSNATVSSPYYSSQKAPFGFINDISIWTVTKTDSSDRQLAGASYTGAVWYTDTTNLKITAPIGLWIPAYKIPIDVLRSGGTGQDVKVTLSTSSSSESDSDLSIYQGLRAGTTAPWEVRFTATMPPYKTITITSATAYYALVNPTAGGTTGDFVKVNGSSYTPTILKFICAYL